MEIKEIQLNESKLAENFCKIYFASLLNFLEERTNHCMKRQNYPYFFLKCLYLFHSTFNMKSLFCSSRLPQLYERTSSWDAECVCFCRSLLSGTQWRLQRCEISSQIAVTDLSISSWGLEQIFSLYPIDWKTSTNKQGMCFSHGHRRRRNVSFRLRLTEWWWGREGPLASRSRSPGRESTQRLCTCWTGWSKQGILQKEHP